MRILFTIPNFITAGSGRAMLNIIERLDRSIFQPAVCVSRKGGSLDREVERMGIPFLEAPFTVKAQPYHTLPIRAWKAAQPFRRYHFDIWHSFHYADDYTEPLISRMAGARAWIYTKKNMNWHRRSWYLRTILATRVAAQNHDMLREFFAENRFRRKATLVPRGVDTACFTPWVVPSLHLRERLGIPANAVVAGCVAHLVPVKGHPSLLQAVARVPELYLLIAGRPLDEVYTANLRQLAHDLNIQERVFFIGDVQQVAAFLVEIDLFVLPTWARWRMEGCPVALLEAMSSGRACIATDIPGSRDLIEHDVSGRLVVPEDVDALAMHLQELAAAPALRQAFGVAARNRVIERFSIEREVAHHVALYTDLAHLKSRGYLPYERHSS